MRKYSVLTLAAGAALVALVITTNQASAQSVAQAQCQSNREACDGKCGPVATGSPWDFGGGGGFQVNQQAIACRGKCKKTFDTCMRRASIMANPPATVVQGVRPQRPTNPTVKPGLLDNATGFSTQGPAATGNPAATGGRPGGAASGSTLR
jgi:hypothetical protein